jgi:thiamine-phosphate diphosphorylase
VRLPRLHVVTDDEVLGRPAFAAQAELILAASGSAIALHLRGHRTSGAVRYALAERLAAAALRSGAWLLVNDRIDIAMAVRANGVQLGRRSLPVAEARALLGAGACIGFSVHDAARAVEAAVDGADFVLMGTIFESKSHPRRQAAGVPALQECAARAGVPVLGIGGFVPAGVASAARAGAWGVAVLGGIWDAPQPPAAAAEYMAAVRQVYPDAAEQEQGT